MEMAPRLIKAEGSSIRMPRIMLRLAIRLALRNPRRRTDPRARQVVEHLTNCSTRVARQLFAGAVTPGRYARSEMACVPTSPDLGPDIDSAPSGGGLSKGDLVAYVPLVMAAVPVSRAGFSSAMDVSDR